LLELYIYIYIGIRYYLNLLVVVGNSWERQNIPTGTFCCLITGLNNSASSFSRCSFSFFSAYLLPKLDSNPESENGDCLWKLIILRVRTQYFKITIVNIFSVIGG